MHLLIASSLGMTPSILALVLLELCLLFCYFFSFIPLSSGAERLEEDDEDVIIEVTGGDITDDIVAADKYDSSSSTAKDAASGPEADSSKKHGVDPSALKPQPVLTDTSMGVISVMGIECK